MIEMMFSSILSLEQVCVKSYNNSSILYSIALWKQPPCLVLLFLLHCQEIQSVSQKISIIFKLHKFCFFFWSACLSLVFQITMFSIKNILLLLFLSNCHIICLSCRGTTCESIAFIFFEVCCEQLWKRTKRARLVTFGKDWINICSP